MLQNEKQQESDQESIKELDGNLSACLLFVTLINIYTKLYSLVQICFKQKNGWMDY